MQKPNKILIFRPAETNYNPTCGAFQRYLTDQGYEYEEVLMNDEQTVEELENQEFNGKRNINEYYKFVYFDEFIPLQDLPSYHDFYSKAKEQAVLPASIANSDKIQFIAAVSQDADEEYNAPPDEKFFIFKELHHVAIITNDANLRKLNDIFPKVQNISTATAPRSSTPPIFRAPIFADADTNNIEVTNTTILPALHQKPRGYAHIIAGSVSASIAITTACLNKIQKGIEKGSIPKIETLKKLVDYIQEQQGKSILLDKRTIGAICTLITLVCADYHIREGASFISQVKQAIAGRGQAPAHADRM